MIDIIPEPSQLLLQHLPLLESLAHKGCSKKVLDLACGSGRNGLYLVKNNIPVVFADNKPSVFETIAERLTTLGALGKDADFWQVDFEQDSTSPLLGKDFEAILVFNYLHRPLIRRIKESVTPGGLLFYETFTTQQATLGRPKNPDFLLQAGELKSWFKDWELIHYFEGRLDLPDRAIANMVARKPEN